MKLPLSILIVLAAAVAVVFAVPNREDVAIKFWPFDAEIAIPLYLAIFTAVFAGFFLGWIGAWLSQHKWRKRARDQARRIEHLEKEVIELEDAAAKTQQAAATPPAALPRWPIPGA